MNDLEVGNRGRAGLAAACVVCCAVPLLVAAGAVTAALAVGIGSAAGAVVLVATVTSLVARGGLRSTPAAARWTLATAGIAAGGAGLWLVETDSTAGRALMAGSVALLATAGLLALAAPAPSRSRDAAAR
jgi:hypothetical protein